MCLFLFWFPLVTSSREYYDYLLHVGIHVNVIVNMYLILGYFHAFISKANRNIYLHTLFDDTYSYRILFSICNLFTVSSYQLLISSNMCVLEEMQKMHNEQPKIMPGMSNINYNWRHRKISIICYRHLENLSLRCIITN